MRHRPHGLVTNTNLKLLGFMQAPTCRRHRPQAFPRSTRYGSTNFLYVGTNPHSNRNWMSSMICQKLCLITNFNSAHSTALFSSLQLSSAALWSTQQQSLTTLCSLLSTIVTLLSITLLSTTHNLLSTLLHTTQAQLSDFYSQHLTGTFGLPCSTQALQP